VPAIIITINYTAVTLSMDSALLLHHVAMGTPLWLRLWMQYLNCSVKTAWTS